MVTAGLGAPHPNSGTLLVDFFLSRAAQEIFRGGDSIPADPDAPPREPSLRPDGMRFRATFYNSEEIDVGMPHWVALFNQLFKSRRLLGRRFGWSGNAVNPGSGSTPPAGKRDFLGTGGALSVDFARFFGSKCIVALALRVRA